MTASSPDSATDPGPLTRTLIHAEWLAGRNTHEISRTLGLPEAQVAEVVRAERERRVGGQQRGRP